MTDTTTDARAKLAAMIHDAGLTMTCEPIPERTTFTDAWKGSKGFHYRCKLTKPGGFWYQCEYSVGRGVVKAWIHGNQTAVRKARPVFGDWEPHAVKDVLPPRESVMVAAMVDDIGKRVFRPELVDVVSSLLMDQSGMSPHETFREWCARMTDDFGMTWTNPADAVDAYDNARLALAFLSRAFGDNLQTATETAGDL